MDDVGSSMIFKQGVAELTCMVDILNSKDVDLLKHLEHPEVESKKEEMGVKVFPEPVEIVHSRAYPQPKRRRISAVWDFPVGCGRNAPLMSKEEFLSIRATDPFDESVEEVASSIVPTKRRRVDTELDESLVDTAISTVANHCHDLCSAYMNKDTSDDAESSCVRGGKKRRLGEEEPETCSDSNHGSNRLKRARIQDTVDVLRRIIPGGKGKDAATILDEAIRYLRSLKMKAKSLGDTPL